MFALFFSLYLSMFYGTWVNRSTYQISDLMKPITNSLGEFITSLFNNVDTPVTTLGDVLMGQTSSIPNWMGLVAFILALITSIGIVVMAVKGIKRVFGVFFGLMR